MIMRFRLLILVMSLFCFIAPVHADVKEELQGIKQEIREKRKLLKKTNKVEAKVSNELVSIDHSLHEKEASLKTLGRELMVVEAGLNRTRGEIDIVKKDLENKKTLIKRRLVSLYKAGEMNNIRMYFSSKTVPQALENRRYMKSVLDQDNKLFGEYQKKLQELQHLKVSLEQEAVRKERVTEKIRLKKQEIESEKSKKAAYLTQVRSEKKGYLVSIRELEANARRLQSMVERLEARSRKSYTAPGEKKAIPGGNHPQPPLSDKGFGAQRGRLTLPVAGSIVSVFGKQKHPEFNSFTYNNGISITAPVNTEIRAVYEGDVIFSDRFKGYGNLVIVDHGAGFFTLYAHAAKLLKKVGVHIAKNETVALVGDTDSPRGPLLYFEIRYQGKPIDPAPWLR